MGAAWKEDPYRAGISVKWLRTAWETFTYSNGRFSRSGLLRTIFNFQLIWIYHYAAVATLPQYGITWEFILLTAICAAVFLSDYRILDKLVPLKGKRGAEPLYGTELYEGRPTGGAKATLPKDPPGL